jgi:excisionase family DNA binding protein
VTDVPGRRFLKLEEVAEMFSTSLAQTYALVRRGELRAIKLGGRGQWRVEMMEVEAYIERAYDTTAEYLRTHPLHDMEEPATAFPEEHDSED